MYLKTLNFQHVFIHKFTVFTRQEFQKNSKILKLKKEL